MIKTTQVVNYRFGVEQGYGFTNVVQNGVYVFAYIHDNTPDGFRVAFSKGVDHIAKEWLKLCQKNNIEVVMSPNDIGTDYKVNGVLATLLQYDIIRSWDEEI